MQLAEGLLRLPCSPSQPRNPSLCRIDLYDVRSRDLADTDISPIPPMNRVASHNAGHLGGLVRR